MSKRAQGCVSSEHNGALDERLRLLYVVCHRYRCSVRSVESLQSPLSIVLNNLSRFVVVLSLRDNLDSLRRWGVLRGWGDDLARALAATW